MIKNRWGAAARPESVGLTLLELVSATALLSLVLGAVGLVQMRVHDASRAGMGSEQVETDCRRTLERVAEELQDVGRGLLITDPSTTRGSGSITYRHPGGATSSLALQLEPAETDNGLDDDGDGLVDERRLVLTQNVGSPDAVSTVLCQGIAKLGEGEAANGLDDNGNGVIDEAGFNIQRTAGQLTIRLTLEGTSGTGGIVSKALHTSIVLHD